MRTLTWAGILLALSMLYAAVSCGGGGTSITPGPGPGPGPGPSPGFTRMAAIVTDASGKPLPGLGIRVDGQPTNVTTDATGHFVLTPANFPKGINVSAELAFGTGGIVIGTKDLVPVDNPDPTIKFDDPNPGGTPGTAHVSGTVYDSGGWGPKPYPMMGMPDAAGNMPVAIQPLDGVEVTLFNAGANAIFQTKSAGGGLYSFDGVSAGTWQIVAQKDGYYPQMGVVKVEDGTNVTYDLSLTQNGSVLPGEGFKVSGVLKDSKTGAPIANATINLYADTGYWGIMMPPMPGGGPDPATGSGGTGNSGGGTTPGGVPDPSRPAAGVNDSSTSDPALPPTPGGGPGILPPDYYRPQNQTTVTAADGTFTFPQEVNGYGLWLDYHADGYLAGNHYEDINGRKTDLSLSLTMDPLVATGVHGHVADASGTPVPNANVQFIFASGGFGGGIAMPGFADIGGVTSNGDTNWEKGAPAPNQSAPNAPPPPGAWGGGANAPMADGSASSPGGTGTGSAGGSGFNNEFMQRYLWEQQHKGTSAVPQDFTGYVSLTTDANGNYSTTDIPAGHYYVMVNAYKHLPYAGEAELVDDPATNVLDVTLPVIPVGSVEGTITDETGAALTDTIVDATQPFVDPFAITDAAGHYRIDNVPTGQWTISAFKSGFITSSQMVEIKENGTVTVNLSLKAYQGGSQTTVGFGGNVVNGSDNSAIGTADIVFTPTDANLGGFARHLQSATDGTYSTTLVPNTDYNVLVQKTGFEDIFFRFWTDQSNPRMDFWLWPEGMAGGGRGGWNGGVPPPMPPKPGDPTTTDPNGARN